MSRSNSENKLTAFQRFTGFFNIEPGEERLVGLLVLLYFILALGFVFVQSMAFGVFLSEYGVKGLPYSYIAIAIFASLVAMFYIRLGGRVSFSKLLFINLIFLACTSLLIWFALKSPLYHITAFILPLWFQIVLNLGNLAVWPLAGSLFDFRQGKRLFPLLGAGNWLANIIGGLFIPALVKTVGATNLMLLAGFSFGAALFILRILTHTYLQPKTDAPKAAQRTARPAKPQTGIFKDRYVLLIFAYTVLWWVAFFFVDNIFYDRAFAQYPDANQLTAFIGRLLSIIGIVALISSTVLTSRVIARFGLRVGLLAMPLLVILSLGMLALSGSLGASLFMVFAVGAFAKLSNVAFGFSTSQSANAIVYQSLPDTMRGRVQTIAEGIVQPIAVGLAGISLLALTAGLKFSYIGLAYVFVGLGVAWLIVIFLLSGNYVRALTRVITKRRLGDDANVLADPASVSLLQSRLQDAHAGVVIYAMNKLEVLDVLSLTPELRSLIQHPAPEVRREAFVRVENLKLKSMLRDVQNQLAVETFPAVKESALRALGAIAEDKSQLTSALNETDVNSLRGALIGLLKCGNEPSAEQKLNHLLAASSNADRNLAIEVMGSVNRRDYYSQLISACDSPQTSRAAGLALIAIGAEALPEIESAFGEKDAPRQRLLTLARVLGHIGGVRSQNILLSRISESDSEVRSKILNALSHSGYRTKDTAMIQGVVKTEVEQAAWISTTQVDIRDSAETLLLQAALTQFHVQIRNRVLLLLSFTFDGDSIRRVREALTVGTSTQASYALEIMDVQLPADWKKLIMPLLENLAPLERSQQLGSFFPQTKRDRAERLIELIENHNLPEWVRACAVYAAKKGDPAMLSNVEKVLILKSVAMFSHTPDNVLADVADLLEELDISENETIFEKGDTGDSMYVILDGKVRVHDGERLLNYLGERDVFGEMALLDPEPRLASVTAVEATRLFRLDQAPFFELMEERPEVATGIIRVLTGRLRDRVRDIGQLNARIKELENGKTG
ncbi:Npt1/Npt2 family nucleotide transporter [Candidatus Villigracilis saccharophilus]|uniref:Npt1/Npt2 family nucleotide transporter n=1 Tax=Candidatus Villigracilis saccharophilus TaxID=3140684 RepID=UPI0031359913|nr:cyclic nucleotide-binding domain-containing protein [Anaerolineales bacterium]